jgi:hypothetical protein
LKIWMPLIEICLPVGSKPGRGPVWVAVALQRPTTVSPQAWSFFVDDVRIRKRGAVHRNRPLPVLTRRRSLRHVRTVIARVRCHDLLADRKVAFVPDVVGDSRY